MAPLRTRQVRLPPPAGPARSQCLAHVLLRPGLRSTGSELIESAILRFEANKSQARSVLAPALARVMSQLTPAQIIALSRDLPSPLDDLLAATWPQLSLNQIAALSEASRRAGGAVPASAEPVARRQRDRAMFEPFVQRLLADESTTGRTGSATLRTASATLRSLSLGTLAGDPRRAFGMTALTPPTQARLFAVGLGFALRSHEVDVQLLRWRRDAVLASATSPGRHGTRTHAAASAGAISSLYQDYAGSVLGGSRGNASARQIAEFVRQERDWLRSHHSLVTKALVTSARHALDRIESGSKG